MKEYLEQNKEEFKPWVEEKKQGRVDIKILPYLQEIDKGFFVEAGALDGLFMSNTKVLEDLGWQGILVEPSKKATAKCRENRKAIVEECALVSKEYPLEEVMGDFVMDGEFGLGAWSSINRHAYGQQARGHFNSFATAVRARTLQSILDEHNVNKIDFLSLDVEGYELEALKGLDFSKTDIRFLLIEVNLRDYSLEDMDNYLAGFGYKNLACLSNFDSTVDGWDGSHNDYLYEKSYQQN